VVVKFHGGLRVTTPMISLERGRLGSIAVRDGFVSGASPEKIDCCSSLCDWFLD